MPDTDLVLNVRQIAGYPPAGSTGPADSVLIQQGGIGGPYASISPSALVETALSTGGVMSIAGVLQAQTVSGGSATFSNAAVGAFTAQTANITTLAAVNGSLAGVPIATTEFASSLVAGLQASTVWSFMGRRGDVRLWIQDIIAAGGAPIYSPRFQGAPMANTPAPNTCNSRLATTAFVHGTVAQYICGLQTSTVVSFNGRTGAVVLTAADIEAAGTDVFAPIDSPAFTGLPSAPTAAIGTSTGQLATTAFVMNAVQESTTGVSSFNTRTGAVSLTAADVTGVGGALTNSPTLTGTPLAPTAPLGTSTGQLATTAFVMNELGGLDAGVVSFNGRSGAVSLNSTDITNAGGALAGPQVASFNGRTGAVTLSGNDVSAAGGLINPNTSLLGVPTAPTAAPGTNTTQLATCAFVAAAIAGISVGVVSFNGRSGAVTLTTADITNAGGATTASVTASLANYLPLTGGVLSGALTISMASPVLFLNKATAANSNQIIGQTNGSTRWNLILGESTAEGGSNTGSNFQITRYSDAGAILDNPLTIARANGTITLTAPIYVAFGQGSILANAPNQYVTVNGSTNFGVGGASSLVVNGGGRASPSAFEFYTGSTRTGTLDNGGNLTVNGNATSYGINTIQFTAGVGQPSFGISDGAGNSRAQFYYNFSSGNTGIYHIGSGQTEGLTNAGAFQITSGTAYKPGGGSWTDSSDERIKTVDGPYELGLAEVLRLEPVRYRYRGNDAAPGDPALKRDLAKQFVGLVAQATETIFPGMVSQREGWIDGKKVDDLRDLNVSELVFALVNAVKELASRVQTLEAAA